MLEPVNLMHKIVLRRHRTQRLVVARLASRRRVQLGARIQGAAQAAEVGEHRQVDAPQRPATHDTRAVVPGGVPAEGIHVGSLAVSWRPRAVRGLPLGRPGRPSGTSSLCAGGRARQMWQGGGQGRSLTDVETLEEQIVEDQLPGHAHRACA